MTKRIGILTGGGDAPGLNAVIRAVVLAAKEKYGWEVFGIKQGFDGLLAGTVPIALTEDSVRNLLSRGGTILGAVNKGNPFLKQVKDSAGEYQQMDMALEGVHKIDALGLDALIVAGGDGTMAIAHSLVQHGAKIVGVPKTIDNDLAQTDLTFGFDTAVATATEALDKLQTTAESHHRIMVMEVMGRNAGWIALVSGVAGGADAILIPEIPFDMNKVIQKIEKIRSQGRLYSLIVVAEGAAPISGEQEFYIRGNPMMQGRLGGIGYLVGNRLAEEENVDVRVTVLGHVQRGGQPTPRDRWLATRFGALAVELVAQEKWGYMLGLNGNLMSPVLMELAVAQNLVEVNGQMMQVARSIGISFGD